MQQEKPGKALPHHENPGSVVKLIPLDENKTITSETNLKQALLNTGQGDRHWPGTYLGFPETGQELC